MNRNLRTVLFCLLTAFMLPTSLLAQEAEKTVQEPAFGETKWNLFDVSWSAPMDTVSGLTEMSRDINGVYSLVTWITVFVFFAVSIPLIYTLVRFRYRKGDETPPKQFHGNSTLEVLWTVIPVVLLIFIAVPTWRVLFKHAKVPADAITIEAIGHQWWWEFRYPSHGNVVTANELHVPENTHIKFVVSSEDVIHAFWIPKWGGKIDALPGHKNTLLLKSPPILDPSKRGGESYQGQCVELCGASHALMRFSAVVHSQGEFDSWVKTANTPPKVETASQVAGEEVFARCQACHTISGTPSEQIPGVKLGPNMSNFGNRKFLAAGLRANTPENFAAWVRNPGSIKPGALMPSLGLTEEEISHVSAYLRQSTVKAF
ncbi:MAG: cytochrome c oxidase subunit II [Proteobacteria bacterium]|nr:cytochrome c oxidase subunit II [Pseudomonadota bacterium]